MGVGRGLAISVALCIAWVAPVSAQSIDCTKARAPIERAICASPQVLLQDQSLARAYAAALSRQPERASEIRAAQGQWLRERNADCARPTDPRGIEACLTQAYAQRIAALSAPQTAATPPAPPLAPDTLAAPAAPLVAVPPAAATLEQTSLPAAERMQTYLHVTSPGRFAIRAQSASGTALQLIDMMTGPTDIAGQAGQTDGRLDLLLDSGVYKLQAFAAAGATGQVGLTVTPFADAVPAEGAPVRGQRDAELGDLQQRRFWLSVSEGESLRIEAAGRALADLVLWRNGRDLVTLPATRRTIEPTTGHPLIDIVLSGKLEPGVYALVAYGAKPLVWADADTAMPFHLRRGASEALEAGWLAAKIGAFGSELYRAGLTSSAVRLDLPDPAAVELIVSGAKGQHQVAIARNAREPTARLSLPADDVDAHLVEVRGAQGQAFQLRLLSGVVTDHLVRNGTYWLSADSFGLGGDEAPVEYLLLHRPSGGAIEVLGSSLPKIGPGSAWRAKFNLRGPVSLPFEVTGGGPVALHAEGVAVQTDIARFGAAFEPRANGTSPGRWDLAAGLYVLRLQPPANAVGASAVGILDLTLGPPGAAVPGPAAPPADTAWPIGLTTLAGNGQLELLATKAGPGYSGLLARPAPVDLAAGPLRLTLRAGEGIDVPLRLPAQGSLIATEFGVGPVAVSFDPVAGPTAGRIGTARLPPADHVRTIALAWQRPIEPPLPVPAPPALPTMQSLTAATPNFLDLKDGGLRSFALDVPSGGLYRVETTGRLRTTGALGTSFLPDLAHETANGAGQNMLIQRFLRAGSYQLLVGAQGSTGHLGVQARPAPVQVGATLTPGGSVRARMAEDAGEIFPIEIQAAGTYRVNVISLAQGLTARLEDDEGWPLRQAGDLSDITQDLPAGRYRLLVQPIGVAARVVARLERVLPAAPMREGHGPFPIAFDMPEHATWREPPGPGETRTPDTWQFALEGPAEVKLSIGDGMVATLQNGSTTVARFTHATPYAARLPGGRFTVLATSEGRNDRLDYTLTLTSTELQPDTPRVVTLPAALRFAIDSTRVVSLTSFGHVPLRGVLRRADGHLVERFGDRGDDWNIGLSRRLPDGEYRLTLEPAIPPRGEPVHAHDTMTAPEASAEPADQDDDAAANTPTNEASDTADAGAPPQSAAGGDTDTAKTPIEVRLALPADRPPISAPASGSIALAGGGVHVIALPPAAEQTLLLAAASAPAEVVMALERRGADGIWRTESTQQGIAPVLGSVGEGSAAAWRALLWTVDGGAAPIRFAARVISGEPQAPGVMTTQKIAFDEMPQTLAAVPVAVPGAGPLTYAGAGKIWVASVSHALAAPDGPWILPQDDRIWVVTTPAAGQLTMTQVDNPTGTVELALPQNGWAWLPYHPPGHGLPGHGFDVWLAESGLGQPGLAAGRLMGVASGSALALSAGDRVRVFNAGGRESLRVRLTRVGLEQLPEQTPDGPFHGSLPPGSALPLILPAGAHRVDVTVAPGTAAITGWRSPDAVTIWSGSEPVSRSVSGAFTDVLLLNTNSHLAPVGLTWQADDPATTLKAGTAFKRFFGAAGSLDMPVDGKGNLLVAGGEATLINPSGQVSHGRVLTLDGTGPGRVVIEHGAGLLAAWVEDADRTPWPNPAPQTVTLPVRLAMHDPAMALAFAAASDTLLHVRSSAPVILRLGDRAPQLFGQGAELHQAVPAGPLRLSVISPHDGPLAGTLEITAEPIAPASEGIGPVLVVAPGGAAAFGFTVARPGPVGVGVRADPDRVSVRLLSAEGTVLGEGVAQLQNLPAGRYVLEAQIPADGVPTQLRPTIVGITPHMSGPPMDVINKYLALAGRVPTPGP